LVEQLLWPKEVGQMSGTRKLVIAGAAILALAAGGTGFALATGNSEEADDAAEQATGAGADQARTAALEITGGGTANAVERDSEDGATWEVEVTKPDGNTVDVRLDENYNEVVVEGDSEEPEGAEENGSE
jgi:uncharacterized membrane protein YkoI